MEETHKVLIVMPVMNLWDEYTIHAMESFAASITDVPFEILIVDNSSKDQTLDKAQDFGGRKMPGRVHTLHNEINRGVAGGWNQGVEWGLERGFQYFLIPNNDILISPVLIQNMYNRMSRGDKLLVSALDVAREVMVAQQVLDMNDPVNKKDVTEAPSPHFSCFMISKETIEKVGWFDEDFFPAFFEDNDYHYRIKQVAGPDGAVAITSAVFYHYGSRTQNQGTGMPVVPGEKFRANEAYFIRKWGGVPMREQYTKPFNDQSKDITYAKRNN